MLYEFAVAPDSLSDWASCRYILDQMGVPLGRMVAELPKRKVWKKMVRAAARSNGCGDRDLKRIEEKLNSVNAKMLPRDRAYDSDRDWIANALAEDARDPFHGIVVRVPPKACPKALDVGLIGPQTPVWAVATEKNVIRRAPDIVAFMAPLLRISRDILFVDPHFNPAKADQWMPVIRQSLKAATDGDRSLERVEIHVLENEKKASDSEFTRACQRNLRAALPAGVKLRVVRWQETREKFHARYVLTNRGGYHLDTGLDVGGPSETQLIALLGDDAHSDCLRRFDAKSTVFKPVYELWLP